MSDRGRRRQKSERVCKRRQKIYKRISGKPVPDGFWKKRTLACGCSMCKPWKWGFKGDSHGAKRRTPISEE